MREGIVISPREDYITKGVTRGGGHFHKNPFLDCLYKEVYTFINVHILLNYSLTSHSLGFFFVLNLDRDSSILNSKILV